MLIIIGYCIVLFSTLGGFIVAGGNPILLLHVSEFIVIGGISAGVLVVASPKHVLVRTVHDVKACFAGGGISRDEVMDLMKMLYELFMVGRRNGLIGLDEHVTSPSTSSIFTKYPSFSKNHHRVAFLCNGLRPVIDGKIKPDQLQEILEGEISAMEDEAHAPQSILTLVGDSLPGIGIVAAVLGIINTMSAIAEGPEKVGEKVAAALTGTFLGILGAYGFINPLNKRLEFSSEEQILYYVSMSKAISGFARGLAPVMAIELARRSIPEAIQPESDELEKTLKSMSTG